MQFAELMQKGVLVSMSIDNVTAERCDCFACMHMMQTVNKHRTGGKFKLPTKRLVEIATIEGARDLGFDRRHRLAHAGQARRPDPRPDRGARTSPRWATPMTRWCNSRSRRMSTRSWSMAASLRRNGRFTALDHDKVTREASDAVGVAQDARANGRPEPMQ